MPEMPRFLADALTPIFARTAQVQEIKEVAPRLRRVRFAGHSLCGRRFRPGQEIEFRVSERAFRHYTPASYDARAGTLDVLFYLHGKGPGSAWAESLAPGQEVGVLGPGGSFGLEPEAAHHLFLGDETCLGLFAAMLAALPAGALSGAIELEPGAESWPAALGLSLVAIPRVEGSRGAALLHWLDAQRPRAESGRVAYLAGHAGTIASLRASLLARGWSPRAIKTKPYWADDKRGL